MKINILLGTFFGGWWSSGNTSYSRRGKRSCGCFKSNDHSLHLVDYWILAV